jgi:hypothetical protein
MRTPHTRSVETDVVSSTLQDKVVAKNLLRMFQ